MNPQSEDTALATQGPVALERAHPQDIAGQLMAVIAANPTAGAENLKALLDSMERVAKWQSEKEFSAAMRACQDDIQPVWRNAVNPHSQSRYAQLEQLDDAIRTIYAKHGFSLSFNSPQSNDKDVTVACRVRHIAGHSEDYTLSGGLDMFGAKGAPNKTSIQGLGSSVSYLRRYLTAMIFNVVFTNDKDDNDGVGAGLSQKQQDSIYELFTACEMDDDSKSKFLTLMKSKSVADIRQVDYQTAITRLNEKLRKVRGV